MKFSISTVLGVLYLLMVGYFVVVLSTTIFHHFPWFLMILLGMLSIAFPASIFSIKQPDTKTEGVIEVFGIGACVISFAMGMIILIGCIRNYSKSDDLVYNGTLSAYNSEQLLNRDFILAMQSSREDGYPDRRILMQKNGTAIIYENVFSYANPHWNPQQEGHKLGVGTWDFQKNMLCIHRAEDSLCGTIDAVNGGLSMNENAIGEIQKISAPYKDIPVTEINSFSIGKSLDYSGKPLFSSIKDPKQDLAMAMRVLDAHPPAILQDVELISDTNTLKLTRYDLRHISGHDVRMEIQMARPDGRSDRMIVLHESGTADLYEIIYHNGTLQISGSGRHSYKWINLQQQVKLLPSELTWNLGNDKLCLKENNNSFCSLLDSEGVLAMNGHPVGRMTVVSEKHERWNPDSLLLPTLAPKESEGFGDNGYFRHSFKNIPQSQTEALKVLKLEK